MADKHDRPKRSAAGAMPREDVQGPVPMHHLLKQGKGDGQTNPFGADAPSTKASTAQKGRPGH